MVTHKVAADLMRLISDLTSLHERCRNASTITPANILCILKYWYPFLDNLANYYTNLIQVTRLIKVCIDYLDKKYFETSQPIEYNDALELSDYSKYWIDIIINEFNMQGTTLIKEEAIEQIREYFKKSNIDELTKQDINDALDCILHLLPTPAAMISLRVAENIVRKYYKKITGNDPTNKNWGEILKELEESKKVKSSILGYLKYLKEKRNEVQHPDKRFTQEESEGLLLKIKDLLEELSKESKD